MNENTYMLTCFVLIKLFFTELRAQTAPTLKEIGFKQMQTSTYAGIVLVPTSSKMHEMISDRSSRAEMLTNLRDIPMRVFSFEKNVGKWQYDQKQHRNVVCRKKKTIFEKLHGPCQCCRKWKTKKISSLNLINLIICNWI